MKIRVSEIPESGLHLVTDRKPDWLSNIPELSSSEQETHLTSDIHLDLLVTKDNRDISVEGTITLTLQTPCSRCMEIVRLTLRPGVHLILTPGIKFGDDSDPESNIDYSTYEGEEVEIGDYLREVLAMDIPYKVLCREECKGLCPTCGANLNFGDCSCRQQWVDERFQVLKKLKTI